MTTILLPIQASGLSGFDHDPPEQLNQKRDELALGLCLALIFAVSPDMTSPSLNEKGSLVAS
jgi:hypothetical protein